jgi:hypothetical protein
MPHGLQLPGENGKSCHFSKVSSLRIKKTGQASFAICHIERLEGVVAGNRRSDG